MKKEVLTFTTEGYAKQRAAKRDGIILTLHNAFADAAGKMTGEQDFIDIATRKFEEEPDDLYGSTVSLPRIPLLRLPIEKNVSSILPSVVTIRAGQYHGSGFFVSEDGLIITNSHVVGEAKFVGIVLNNGLETRGEVLRRNDRRDVALVKVDLRVPEALAIRETDVKSLERVYAVGSPLIEDLKSTVTSGVVSAVRHDSKTGLLMIQADVPVTGGNSGGPLLDDQGNIVGLTVAGYTAGEGLNLFIPIAEALEVLKIGLVNAPSS